jgi:aryl-alcohol dehydrogenase-like predicted oxidoreductase
VGVRAAREVATHTPSGASTAQLALRWVVDQPGVSTVIPGARDAEQARANAGAAGLGPLDVPTLEALRRIYDEHVRAAVHDRW